MAEIHMEKRERSSMGWLWILLAILLIALLVWWFWPDEPEIAAIDTTPTPMTATAVVTDPVTPAANTVATLAAITSDPQQWVGKEYSGMVTVVEVPTDRGFWIEENGARMLALVDDGPAEAPIDINQGQQIRIRGTIRDAAYLPNLPGKPLDADTKALVDQNPVYLVAGESAIEIVDRPAA